MEENLSYHYLSLKLLKVKKFMKILVLGASGMLGHIVSYYFKKKNKNIIPCSRSKTNINFIDKLLIKIPNYNKTEISNLINNHRPCIIINCVGATDIKKDQQFFESINADLPKILQNLINSKNDGSQLIQISTNGVFSGNRGNYTESDLPNPTDAYSKSKLKGEVLEPPHLTIRTSIIGTEIKNKKGLLEWFLNQKNEVKGYNKVLWNGVTTLECAIFIDWAIENKLSGLIHLYSETISKYELLNIIKKVYEKKIKVVPDNKIKLNQTLASNNKKMNYKVQGHIAMIKELKETLIDRA
jgi:dTDP-4-dehydrorhamnose reductase